MDMVDTWVAESARAGIPADPAALRLIQQQDVLLLFLAYQVSWAVTFCRNLDLDCGELESVPLDSIDAIQQWTKTMSRLREEVRSAHEPTEAAKDAAAAIAKASCGFASVAALKSNFDRQHRRALDAWSPLVGQSKSFLVNAAIDAAIEVLPRLPALLRSMPMMFWGAYRTASVARVGGAAEREIVAAARAGAAGVGLAILAHELASYASLVGMAALKKGVSTCQDRPDGTRARFDPAVKWLRGRARLIGKGKCLERPRSAWACR